ncbi:MAG: IS1634 family transposase [Chloroflexota bacterium]|nr:IS1634 family transposase [Chloroflexota bacterium]
MDESTDITTERVDDIPLLVAQMRRMGLPVLVECHFPTHGNRGGLNVGWTAVVWLAHILSRGDHRLNQVQPWAARRLETLRACTGQPIEELDLTDDRLADVLRLLADDTHGVSVERALGQELRRVYDLAPACVRVDMTTASQAGPVTEEGLFQFGYSKDRRPDAPQVKVGLATLDPLGLPLASVVVPGDRADDPLYVPLIKQARAVVGRRGVLYVGDCKMGALATRATVENGYNYDLCPLAATQVPAETLERYLAEAWASGPPERIERTGADGTVAHLADSYARAEPCATVIEGWMDVTWTERRLLIRSVAQATAAETALRARVARAHQAITDLTAARRGKRRLATVEAVRAAATAVLTRYDVDGLIHVTSTEDIQERPMRAYAERPAQVRQTRTLHVHATLDTAALAAAVARLGWRVYATNAPAATLSATQAVLAYRQEYLIERGFGRLKGRPLSLSPLYLERDDHVTGLIRLLTIALRVLTTLDHAARARLDQEQRALAGLYVGNPTRATRHPTAELLLTAFKEITLTMVRTPQVTLRHLTPLSPLQHDILALLGFTPAIYAFVEHYLPQPP